MNTTQTAGDDDIADIIVRLRPVLLKAIRPFGLADDEVEDAVQQTWTIFLRHRSTIEHDKALSSWLWVTARRVAMRSANSRRREVPVARIDDRAFVAEENLIDELMRRSRHEALWKAVGTLHPRDRLLIRLLAHDPRMSYQDIASRMGVHPQSVGPMRTRCLRTLRTRMSNLGVMSC